MFFPKSWSKAAAPDKPNIAVWGWGDDPATARAEAANRLKRLLERLARGEPFPEKYTYAQARPLREEILRTIGDEAAPAAVVTRNRYGAQVLNTARVLFLDIDVAPSGLDGLKRLFGGKSAKQAALERLRTQLKAYGRATFRIYETAGGYRALAVDREFDPAGDETARLMRDTGTDPDFLTLCRAQKSFRARLTPKPWRCGVKTWAPDYPREGAGDELAFKEWLAKYERAGGAFATCRFVEAVGEASARGAGRDVVDLHDRLTRASEKLPLA